MSDKMYTYLMFDGRYYKIGQSKNPQKRLKTLRTANPSIGMICYGTGISENALHKKYAHLRVSGEWFDLKGAASRVAKHINNEDTTYVMPTGKWKGRRLWEIPAKYLRMYLKRRVSDEDAKREIRLWLSDRNM